MSYLEDWVRQNQGLGRDEVTRKMTGAGYDRSEIDAAWRRRGRSADSAATTSSAPRVARTLPGRPEWLENQGARWLILGAVTLAMIAAVLLLDIDLRVALVVGFLIWRFGLRRAKPSEPPPAPPAER